MRILSQTNRIGEEDLLEFGGMSRDLDHAYGVIQTYSALHNVFARLKISTNISSVRRRVFVL